MNIMSINLSAKGGNKPTKEPFNGTKYKLLSGRNWNLNYFHSSKYGRIKILLTQKNLWLKQMYALKHTKYLSTTLCVKGNITHSGFT